MCGKLRSDLARLHEQLWERSKAEQAYRKALEIHPRSFAPLGHYVLADVYSRQGNHAAAARAAEKGKALEGRARTSR